MGKRRMERVLAPILNEFRIEGLLDLWKREQELKMDLKNRHGLNKVIRENKAVLKILKAQGEGHGT
jgi:hypothetical protein